MDLSSLARQIKSFIGQGQTGEALETMEAQLQSWRRFHDQIVMLQAQYYECQQDERAGTIDPAEAQLRQNRVNNGILTLLAELEDASMQLKTAAPAAKSADPPPSAKPADTPPAPAALTGETDIPFEPKQWLFKNDPAFVIQFQRVFVRPEGADLSLVFDLKFTNKKTDDSNLYLQSFNEPIWRLFDDQGEFIEPAENNVPYHVEPLTSQTGSMVFRFPRTVRIESVGVFFSDPAVEDLRWVIDWSGVG